MTSLPGRDLEVAPERVDRWVAGFTERHGQTTVERDGGVVVVVSAADGSTASFEWFTHDPVGVVLVRRGGYGVGLVREGLVRTIGGGAQTLAGTLLGSAAHGARGRRTFARGSGMLAGAVGRSYAEYARSAA